MVWDVGANTGEYSFMPSGARYTVAMDADAAAVDRIYQRARERDDVLPLVQDITDPSPDQGWAQQERSGLQSRGPADLVLWLALSHHLGLTRAVPPAQQAQWIASLAERAVVEFVPLQDPLAQRLVAWRDPASLDQRYSRGEFESALDTHFREVQAHPLPASDRIIYTVAR